MNNNDIDTKQEYLRKEILDSNYDADDFLKFLMNKKDLDEIDLNDWSLAELKQTVEEYKNKIDKHCQETITLSQPLNNYASPNKM